MATIHDLKKSKYLSRADVVSPILVTIKSYSEMNVAMEGDEKEMRYVLHLVEQEKPFIINSTNGQIIAQINGSEDLDNWAGTKIVVYFDPNIAMGGRLVGGLRVRAPKNQPKVLPKPAESLPPVDPAAEDDSDSVPF